YSSHHTIESLESSTSYRYRLRITRPTGESLYSPAVSVSTTHEYTVHSEPMSGKNLHRADNMNDEEELTRVLQSGTINVNVNDKHVVKYLRMFGATWQSQDMGGLYPPPLGS
ncbi:unnamed protein product, partial [Coregonus sp. 'balchen']